MIGSMPTLPLRLPVIPDLDPDIDLGYYVAHLAAANHLTTTAVSRHPAHSRYWEQPPEADLARLARATTFSVEELRAHTLAGVLPKLEPYWHRLGRRWHRAPVHCPACGLARFPAARVQLVVLCPRCGSLLVDEVHPQTWKPSPYLQAVQEELWEAADVYGDRALLGRVERCLTSAARTVTVSWPRPFAGEDPSWREWTVSWENGVLPLPYLVMRPPAVTAELLGLTWEYSSSEKATRWFTAACALMGDTTLLCHPEGHLGWDGLCARMRALQLRPEHIPSLLRHDLAPIVLPREWVTVRCAQALLLTAAANSEVAQQHTWRRAATYLRLHPTQHLMDVADLAATNGHVLADLAQVAETLAVGGRDDFHGRREALHTVDVPAGVRRALPSAARDLDADRDLAATWVWLDATAGALAGGPNPTVSREKLLAYDQALQPDGRLHLRDWWTELLAAPNRDVALTTPRRDRHDHVRAIG